MTEQPPLVLIADDEQHMITLLQRLFEREGYAVEGVADGLTALEKAIELRPDLILMDVQMPGMDGFEVVRRLRQHEITTRIPTIFITAAARDPNDVVKGLGLGADDYVLKPFNPYELLARAHSKIRARQLEESLERRNRELEALVTIGREFNQRLELDKLLDLIVSVSASELPADQALLCLFDDNQQIIAWRTLRDVNSAARRIQNFVKRPAPWLAEMLYDGHPVLTSAEDQPLVLDCCHAVIGTRIIHHGNVLGIILLGHEDANCYDSGHLRLLESITEQAALAIRNAELYAELRHYAENLEAMVAERTAELRAAQSQLIRSEKLASLGRLAAGIAHEVNNPLQAIRNCLELAIEDIDDQRPVDKELLVVAEEDVGRIRRIVSGLLDFARPGSGKLALIDLGKLVSEMLRLAQRQLEMADITAQTEIQPTPAVRVSEDQFKQVILNLILNAQEAMPYGGTLTVRVFEEGQYIHIAFIDTGIGIPEENLNRIFDPFFSTKVDGTGLGLAITYGIVEGHSGRIEVESKVGSGTAFTVILPFETKTS
ncbi:MAG: response regulator [Anaerolineae bacterium]|nr:response regulator [Anaerolineae bacterium]